MNRDLPGTFRRLQCREGGREQLASPSSFADVEGDCRLEIRPEHKVGVMGVGRGRRLLASAVQPPAHPPLGTTCGPKSLRQHPPAFLSMSPVSHPPPLLRSR